jgi:hypothetical protein
VFGASALLGIWELWDFNMAPALGVASPLSLSWVYASQKSPIPLARSHWKAGSSKTGSRKILATWPCRFLHFVQVVNVGNPGRFVLTDQNLPPQLRSNQLRSDVQVVRRKVVLTEYL